MIPLLAAVVATMAVPVALDISFAVPATVVEARVAPSGFEGRSQSLSSGEIHAESLEWHTVRVPALHSDEGVYDGYVSHESMPSEPQALGAAMVRLSPLAQHGVLIMGVDCHGVGLAHASLFGVAAEDGTAGQVAPTEFHAPELRSSTWGAAQDSVYGSATATITGPCASLRIELYNVTGSIATSEGIHELENGRTAGQMPGPVLDQYDVLMITNATFDTLSFGKTYVAAPGDVTSLSRIFLPIASGRLASEHGTVMHNGTWSFVGNLTLSGITPSKGGFLTASGHGVISDLTIDGEPMAWDTKSSLAVAGTSLSIVAIAAAAAKYIHATALFTRLSPKEALEHPRRQALLEYIQQHPGATFRELCRATGIPAGTCRHHLSVLDRAQVIVEHRHRSTVRFFENHGKFDHSWHEVVMLRDAELDRLHGWLKENERSVQKQILEHALTAWGWSRSTTQHRLQRLVDNGLVSVHEMGRRKLYSIVERQEVERPRVFGLTMPG